MSISENLSRVMDRITRAAESVGRSPADITLVGVTKYVGPREAGELIAAGCHDLAESRPQELWSKADDLGAATFTDKPPRWHLIGHLQRNKIRRTLPLVSLIHSVDSERLLAAINTEREINANADAGGTGRPQSRAAGSPDELGSQAPVRVLLEVNTSGEPSKHGLLPDAVESLLVAAADCPRVAIRGLMTMAAFEGGPTVAARNFATLRELRERLRSVAPDCASLDELSMGMSADFEVAIREGATIVRVGSILWENT